ncbi:zinc-dependent alcohol dehydrogenase [Paenibacillus thalictri]|uniref:Pyridoxal-phosphate dependent enzyme n=1 Tax=Paenibacillus thalictri TaxID=2527873 RepID=A0A4Q9DW22_9BACL|nr:alcohol dehydrogenase catalytic domain-containing protein [Paenibacillus thalictri]TBL81229.1 pyridoxal-phosphate dependent enzyme [Paenibacillus thalictri]
MNKKTIAAVATAVKTTELRQFDLPVITDDSGLLRIETVGVCGTDVSYYKKSQSPRILGHHIVGFIEKIGETAAARWGVQEGDRVALEEYIPCGQCSFCRTGMYRSCKTTDPRAGGIRYGATPIEINPSLWGGFSEYMYLHPNSVLHPMPRHVPAAEAALTLPLANGFEWMSLQGGAAPGKTVVIQGPGQQGLACTLAAKAAGASCVIVTGRTTSMKRLELSKRLGADHIVNIQTEDLESRVREITGGKMADIVIDVTSGGTEPVQSSIAVAGRGATVMFGAYKYMKMPEFDIDMIVTKTLQLKGVRGHSYQSVKMAVECIASGMFPLGIMNSHDYALEETDMALKTAGGEGEPSPLLVTVSPGKAAR